MVGAASKVPAAFANTEWGAHGLWLYTTKRGVVTRLPQDAKTFIRKNSF
jgi:hypothetical protein